MTSLSWAVGYARGADDQRRGGAKREEGGGGSSGDQRQEGSGPHRAGVLCAGVAETRSTARRSSITRQPRLQDGAWRSAPRREMCLLGRRGACGRLTATTDRDGEILCAVRPPVTNGATKVPGVPKARTGLYRNATLCVDAVIVSFVRRCPMWPVYGVTTLLIIIIICLDRG